MIHVIFTLDYEIHGNGEGSPLSLMIEPTDRILNLFDKYGAKLTIMADVAEILKFKEYRDRYGRDDYSYNAIIEQLRTAIRTGHDVQLHIHPSYFNATCRDGRWYQDWSEYDFANLPYARMEWMVRICKEFLEETLKPIESTYTCNAFRAANWSVSPSSTLVRALLDNNIRIDTSVFKWGHRQGLVNFDYSSAHSTVLPWPASPDNICCYDANSRFWEFPIYSESRWIGAFATSNRINRAILGKLHKIPDDVYPLRKNRLANSTRIQKLARVFKKSAWKADFNQCSGRQLIRALLRAKMLVKDEPDASFLAIGHSKLFNQWNGLTLRPYLAFVRKHSSWVSFGTLTGVSMLSRTPRIL